MYFTDELNSKISSADLTNQSTTVEAIFNLWNYIIKEAYMKIEKSAIKKQKILHNLYKVPYFLEKWGKFHGTSISYTYGFVYVSIFLLYLEEFGLTKKLSECSG